MRALAIGRVIGLAAMLMLLCGLVRAQSRPAIISDYRWVHPTTVPLTSHRAAAASQPRDGVILDVFPDLTPGAGEFQEGSPPDARPERQRPDRPSRHGLPTPQWRRNPLLPQGKTSEA